MSLRTFFLYEGVWQNLSGPRPWFPESMLGAGSKTPTSIYAAVPAKKTSASRRGRYRACVVSGCFDMAYTDSVS